MKTRLLMAMAALMWLAMAPAMAQGAPNAEKLGWRLGCQAYSFNRFTFFEAVDKTASLGLKYIEAYPGQKLSPEHPELIFDHNMSEDTMKMVKAKLDSAGVKLVNYGVVGLPNNEAACKKVFDFAQKMGIETICSEPPANAFDLLDKMTKKYKINVAIHNHPKPSPYWNYEAVLKNCEGHGKRIGACADTGHWLRSGIVPLDAIKALEGRIISFHFKDLNEASKDAHDVPWGTGKADVKALLTEIHRQGIKAVFSIEYEHNWENSVPDIAQCVAYFDKVAAELAR
ncbi:MAG TPA: sugar phosphate isomerase/epimerase [Candidatus Hydrogenedentes bacterium]|nr:sugar phosphate isomerase/epimerase [Candidatus Hydrogenedentota bacterium]